MPERFDAVCHKIQMHKIKFENYWHVAGREVIKVHVKGLLSVVKNVNKTIVSVFLNLINFGKLWRVE